MSLNKPFHSQEKKLQRCLHVLSCWSIVEVFWHNQSATCICSAREHDTKHTHIMNNYNNNTDLDDTRSQNSLVNSHRSTPKTPVLMWQLKLNSFTSTHDIITVMLLMWKSNTNNKQQWILSEIFLVWPQTPYKHEGPWPWPRSSE